MPTYGDIARLRAFSVPALAAAVEAFGVVAPNEGFTVGQLHCHQSVPRTAVGLAVTVRVTTDRAPADAPPPVDDDAYWHFVEHAEGPTKFVVVQDLDDPPGGAVWGEGIASLHMAFACIGTITQGAVRDIDALTRRGFDVFATTTTAGRGYGTIVDFGEPVDVAGLTIATGDLLAADQHGVLRIPDIPIDELLQVADQVSRLEFELFARSQSPHFDRSTLPELTQEVRDRWPRPNLETDDGAG